MHTPAPAGTTILRVLRLALHASFFVLLAIATVRLFVTRDAGVHSYAALCGAVVLAALYAAGLMWSRRHRWLDLVWLAAITTEWALLLAASPDFSWVAFPLFFLHLALLARWHAVAAVVAITGLVVLAQIAHAQGWSVGMVLGPALGAVFAIVMAWGYAAIAAESEQRRLLIDDLTRTREELATSQHRAGVLAERERLAREIHDTLAQGFSSVVLLLRSAQASLPEDPERVAGRISEAQETAADGLAEARRFVRDLAPPSLSAGTLPEALGRLCERTERESGIRCSLRIDGDVSGMSSGFEVALLRAAQASLANVVQHSGAENSVVTLGFLDDEVTLDIYDDGVGFDRDTLESRSDGSGYGLTALRERITALSGTLEVESSAGEGTVIGIRLPLTAEEHR
ncbi:sensor histidine kinase [Allosaccharopolyspora coralli]|uniref:sensor histidine kinase n=1 Tax=Allosaccharopolyspora coralli TaxID=2665642 RepID=UPI001C9E42AC|nr:sensor histidine kinase [Allosaccharopolyspora coralli]